MPKSHNEEYKWGNKKLLYKKKSIMTCINHIIISIIDDSQRKYIIVNMIVNQIIYWTLKLSRV